MAKKTEKFGMSLVIVESPAKAKTINKYLGSSFDVMASMGHVRDLPEKGISIDIANKFEPTYDIMPGKKKTVISLKAAAKKCDYLYLATDLDREGEAIAWHLAQILGFPEDKTYRVIFNAITESAIKKAFAEPGRIDIDKVNAQQARRILDRIVGYQISPLLWKKVARGLSAGRVQSVAVKMVVEKEREIKAFIPEEYWLIPAVFTSDLNNNYSQQWQDYLNSNGKDNPPTLDEQNRWLAERSSFKAELNQVGDQKFHASKTEDAHKVADALKGAAFSISNLESKEVSSKASPPFITSTLQQSASNRLGFAAKRTMMVAQQLYEGIDLGSMGSLGLITYMRTDSTHISPEAINDVRNFIGKNFGSQYVPAEPFFYSAKKNAQQAHEAIRPTDPDMRPGDVQKYLTEEQFKLYDLIWRRFVASQTAAAKWNVKTVTISAQTSIGTCLYRTVGRSLVFDGFTKVWYTGSPEQQLPELSIGQKIAAVDIAAEQHFTKPPARYNEASLVKALEKEGIGRPSTYASIISTIQDRGYVKQQEKKFYATDLAEIVTDKLSEYFPQIMDIAFTRYMEEQLDKIEEQHLDWVGVLTEFYGPFSKNLEKAGEEMKHAKAEMTPSEYICPKCGKNLSYRFGKNGKFLSCSAYPECKFASPCDKDGKMFVEKPTEHKCPKCGKFMINKIGRFGKFLGCPDYPTCKSILRVDKEGNVMPPKPPAEPTGIKCHKCKDGEFVLRQSKKGPFMGCNKFPRCRTIVSFKNLDKLKQLQLDGQWPPKSEKELETILEKDAKPKRVPRKKTLAE